VAQIYLAHDREDGQAADRLAEVFRFFDYDVALVSAESMNSSDLPFQDFSETDVFLVFWTDEARRNPWIASQCRHMKESSQMVVVMSKPAASNALPLMICESCVVPARDVIHGSWSALQPPWNWTLCPCDFSKEKTR